MTDNVVELMSAKIQRLSPDLREVLKIGACIGSRFDLKTISMASDLKEENVRETLELAMMEGLIAPSENDFSFVHDRIQQASYARIQAV